MATPKIFNKRKYKNSLHFSRIQISVREDDSCDAIYMQHKYIKNLNKILCTFSGMFIAKTTTTKFSSLNGTHWYKKQQISSKKSDNLPTFVLLYPFYIIFSIFFKLKNWWFFFKIEHEIFFIFWSSFVELFFFVELIFNKLIVDLILKYCNLKKILGWKLIFLPTWVASMFHLYILEYFVM